MEQPTCRRTLFRFACLSRLVSIIFQLLEISLTEKVLIRDILHLLRSNAEQSHFASKTNAKKRSA